MALELLEAAEGRLSAADLRPADEIAAARLHRLLSTAIEGNHLLTAGGLLISANDAAAQLLGYPSAHDLTAAVPDAAALCTSPGHDAVLHGLHKGSGAYSYDATLCGRAGMAVRAHCFARSLSDAQGAIIAVDVLWRPVVVPTQETSAAQ